MDKDQKLEQLIETCGYGLLKPARRLLEEGVDVNGSLNGYTPLIASICGQDIELVELLIKHGATINQGTHTVLHEAIEAVLENMMDEGAKKPDNDELKIINLLIRKGGNLEQKNLKGETPLESLNKFSSNEASFELLKNHFREIIPDIDKRIEYKKKR